MIQRFQILILWIIYALALTLLIWSIALFCYQYIAAVGLFSDVMKAFTHPRILNALYLSITSAFVTVFIAILFGVPLGYLFAIKNFRGKTLLETITIDVPQTFPPIAEGIILLLMLGPSSPFRINLAYTFTSLVISKLFVSAPFVIAFSTRKFREIQQAEFDIIAKTLGANEFHVFLTIFIPLALKDIIAGASLCWARAMGELGGSLIFSAVIPFKTETIPTFIATNSSHTPFALAATILVTTASLLALVSFKKIVPGNNLWKALFYRI